jgi:signal transduction histidine kinase
VRLKTPATVGMFQLFAELIGQHLDAQERMRASESELQSERTDAQLREQFIAVLGHDLRNPLAAIAGGAELLRRMPHNATGAELVMMIKRSAARMSGLIENILDFARGRLGGGLVLSRAPDPRLAMTIAHVIDELQTASPDRQLHREISIDGPIHCDGARIGQLVSNLLANAITHGDIDSPIWIRARGDAGGFELSVINRGHTIPPHIVEHLFQPFARGKARAKDEGLGLGLYIASEIARAHDGTLSVRSADGETCFTFRMPMVA